MRMKNLKTSLKLTFDLKLSGYPSKHHPKASTTQSSERSNLCTSKSVNFPGTKNEICQFSCQKKTNFNFTISERESWNPRDLKEGFNEWLTWLEFAFVIPSPSSLVYRIVVLKSQHARGTSHDGSITGVPGPLDPSPLVGTYSSLMPRDLWWS